MSKVLKRLHSQANQPSTNKEPIAIDDELKRLRELAHKYGYALVAVY